MKYHCLAWLACPDCGGDLRFTDLPKYPHEGKDLQEGTLACAGCGRTFELIDGIPQLYPKGRAESGVTRTQQSFAWEWLRYPGSLEEDPEVFLEETQVPRADWAGKVVLDAGCGMGRYTAVALGLGAEAVAFDLSASITRLIGLAKKQPKLHLVQGDLHRPPFKKGVFDIVYSQGVLHHTSDTRKAFDAVAPLVREGGRLSVWLYGRPGSWESFSTNPLKSTRSWLKRVLPLVWLLVWVRLVFSDFVRVFTVVLPMNLLYALCFPLAWLGAVPLFKYLTFSVHRDRRVRLIENFDWLAPPFQFKHTKEELRAWFSAAGIEVESQLPHGVVPKVGMLGRKPLRRRS